MASGKRLPSAASQLLAPNRSAYVCQSCRRRLHNTPVSKSSQTQVRRSTGSAFLDSVRKKIWGTDNPPGLANPYGPGWREKKKMREEAERRENLSPAQQAGEDAGDQIVLDETPVDVNANPYVPAQTWDGLRHIGHRGHWKDIAPTEADEYQPYVAEMR
jgi:hypothetical protein